MKIVCIIQARMESTRLPKKILLPLGGKSVLENVVERVSKSKLIDDIIVATTTNGADEEVVSYCELKNIKCYRGSENDVLDRYYQTAKQFICEHVVRITSDCPLIDYQVIDKVIGEHLSSNSDYTSNTLVETYPDGLDIEIMKYEALEYAWNKANLKSEREHVTPYIKNNQDKFKLQSIEYEEDLSKHRWTIDEPRDYEFLQKIFNYLEESNNNFVMSDILNCIIENKEVLNINSDIIRNEGYLKSLEEDEKMNE